MLIEVRVRQRSRTERRRGGLKPGDKVKVITTDVISFNWAWWGYSTVGAGVVKTSKPLGEV